MFDIVMPLFNKAAFVEEAIRSVIEQSHAEWRLFVVDDGSSDRGADVVRSFQDPRILLIEQSNQGVGPARNTGIGAGTAQWIAFLDADDVWHAEHLSELDALRRDFPEAVLIGCGFTRFSGGPGAASNLAGVSTRRLVRYFGECARGAELFLTSSAAVRRSTIADVGCFEDLPGNEDVELWARLALHGPVAVSSRRTVNYRVDTGGITDTGMTKRSTTPKAARREDISSTIPTLDRALPGIADPRLRGEIAAYMDSRVGICLTTAVLEGDFGYARNLRRLYSGKPRGKARIAAAIAKLPKPLARAAMAIRRRIKLLRSAP